MPIVVYYYLSEAAFLFVFLWSDAKMIKEAFDRVYANFKMHFYHDIFKKWRGRELSLTTFESFCMEIIYILGRPTVSEFARFASLSSANAAEKINKLIAKGYINKVQSKTDRRRYYLEPTEKYNEYYQINSSYIDKVMGKLRDRFPKEELDIFANILNVMHDELMDPIPYIRKKDS